MTKVYILSAILFTGLAIYEFAIGETSMGVLAAGIAVLDVVVGIMDYRTKVDAS